MPGRGLSEWGTRSAAILVHFDGLRPMAAFWRYHVSYLLGTPVTECTRSRQLISLDLARSRAILTVLTRSGVALVGTGAYQQLTPRSSAPYITRIVTLDVHGGWICQEPTNRLREVADGALLYRELRVKSCEWNVIKTGRGQA